YRLCRANVGTGNMYDAQMIIIQLLPLKSSGDFTFHFTIRITTYLPPNDSLQLCTQHLSIEHSCKQAKVSIPDSNHPSCKWSFHLAYNTSNNVKLATSVGISSATALLLNPAPAPQTPTREK